jgi:putative ATP-dependent endonuclease of OLD family
MKIRRIVVSNFCSIEKADFCPSEFSILVGQNNHGKTNFFEAVSWFYSGKGDLDDLRFGRSGTAEVSVEIEFTGVQDALLKMKNEKNRSRETKQRRCKSKKNLRREVGGMDRKKSRWIRYRV